MDMLLELHDPWGRRIAWFDELPLLDAVASVGDGPDTLRGLLPLSVQSVPAGSRVRLLLDGQPVAEGTLTRVVPEWGDFKKLVADRYVRSHEIIAFEASRDGLVWNTPVCEGFTGRSVDTIVRRLIQIAPGQVHYTIDHGAFPDGAAREWAKFSARRTDANALETGGIASGQWAGPGRVNASAAIATSGDTIAGLVVDGVAWPPVLLLMVDAEEPVLNIRAWQRHPETIAWTPARYGRSVYALRAEAARVTLQGMIAAHGIDHVELNPHRGRDGAHDHRVDAYGRYVALVYGGGLCLNAAMVESGTAGVDLHKEGVCHDPDMELKDYFSYTGPAVASVGVSPVVLRAYTADGGLLEHLTSLAYAAGGWIWSADPGGRVTFREPARPDRVLFDDPLRTGVALGSDRSGMANALVFSAAPDGPLRDIRYTESASAWAYGLTERPFYGLAVSHREDADLLMRGLLADVGWPAPAGEITFFNGDARVRPGDLVELRGERFRALDPGDPGGWFAGRRVARVASVRHRIAGRRVETIAALTAPLRSVADPVAFMVRSQAPEGRYYQARLDDDGAALDDIAHLD